MSFERERRTMVEQQLARRGIHDPRVLEAMGAIRRECFVDERDLGNAYADAPVEIGYGQTISQPFMTALMCQELRLRGDERVLDVGTGSGYHAAVLSMLAAQVCSIEVVPELCALAGRNLVDAGVGTNVTLECGDGSRGWPEALWFDGISVAAAAPAVPEALLAQLQEPGTLVIPVGSREEQDLLVLTRVAGHLKERRVTGCRFVPLIGEQGWSS